MSKLQVLSPPRTKRHNVAYHLPLVTSASSPITFRRSVCMGVVGRRD
ncbi:hypothetical protein [Chroococcidiopsis sp. CCMEE 29]|nr:hypothetical protein [Chroococcidiopsis sp. CCMEE 29]